MTAIPSGKEQSISFETAGEQVRINRMSLDFKACKGASDMRLRFDRLTVPSFVEGD